jgi:hypothetical protein
MRMPESEGIVDRDRHHLFTADLAAPSQLGRARSSEKQQL